MAHASPDDLCAPQPAIGFNPVLADRDAPDWIDDSVPDDGLARMRVRRSMLQSACNPLRQLLGKRWLGDRDDRAIVRRLHALGALRDVGEQQAKVARADAPAFIAPVYFVGFPAILNSRAGSTASSASASLSA